MKREDRALFSIVIALGLLATLTLIGNLSAQAQSSPTQQLADFHKGLLKRYPDVNHISPDTLASLPQSEVILFDVRKPSEYNVSHLPSAIRITPGMRAKDFLRKYRDQLRGKKIVFYCSVGERSSKLAEAVQEAAGQATFDVVNLQGGIFKWHNQQRSLINKSGPTHYVHPFSSYWGRLLVHQEKVRRE